MKVDRASRGGKKGSLCGREDIVVTVPNQESAESRLKPPVVSSHPRKIILNQNKTEFKELNKVTVKSLDEIKREKEQRQKQSTATSPSTQANAATTIKIPNGGTSVMGHTSRPMTRSGPDVVRTSAVTTHAEATSSARVCSVKANLPLKELRVPIKPLPNTNYKFLKAKSQPLASPSSSCEPPEVSMDLDSQLPEQDFDYVDEDEEGSDESEDLDEDYLLRDDEEERRFSSHQDTNGGFNFDRLSGFTDTTSTLSDEGDDKLSIHPDDSLFDDEDEPQGSDERQVSRSLGRRSGSELRDLRSKLGEKQKHIPEIPSKTGMRTAGEPDLKEEKVTSESKETQSVEDKTNVEHRRSDSREKNPRNPSCRTWRTNQNDRDKSRNRRLPDGRRNDVMHIKNDIPRRGAHPSRHDQRKGSRPNIASQFGDLLPTLGTGDGLLPTPGASTVPVGVIANMTMLDMAIKKNIQETVNLLTNPPPVPGETVTRFEESLRQPSLPCLPHDKWVKQHNQATKRQQSHMQGTKNTRKPDRLGFSKSKAQTITSLPSQQNRPQNDTRPKWLQQSISGTKQNVEQGNLNIVFQGSSVEAVPVQEISESDVVHSSLATHRRLEQPGSQINPNSMLISHPTSPNKRKSTFENEEEVHGSKLVIGTSPEGLPQPNNTRAQRAYPKPLCPQQLKFGKCVDSHCQCWHLSRAELEEHQRFQRTEQKSQEKLKGREMVEQVLASHHQKEDTPGVSYNVVIALLKDEKLGAAWQLIERLHRMNCPPELHILQRVLYLCSRLKEEPAVASQVACKAFDMIGGMVPCHNRHSYETLIKALCHSGQYIRAGEMLQVMKKNGHAPTYEVFLDLVDAAEKDPDRAFDLVDEIRQAGVFKSKICSDLILLGSRSGEMFVDRTFLLFQEALQKNIQLSADAVSAMLFFLYQTNHWEKIMHILPSVAEKIPIEILNPLVMTASQRVDWVEMIITALSMIPAEKLMALGTDVWNRFLSNCCQVHSDNVSIAKRIYALMQQNEIPLLPEAANDYLAHLSKNNSTAAFELFIEISEGTQVFEQPQILECGLNALSVALNNDNLGADMLRVVHFMLECEIKPVDSVLQAGVEHLDKEENYKGVYQFFKQLEAAAIVPPFLVYKAIISSLEKWEENPTASSEPYVSMRRAYPGGQLSEADTKKEVVDSEKRQKHGKQVCQYFFKPKGCFNGEKCRFLHPEVPKHSVASSQDSILPRPSHSYMAPGVQKVQDSSHVSEGRATSSAQPPTISAPSNPFIAQAPGAQATFSGVPPVASQVPQPLECNQTNLPFVSHKASDSSAHFTANTNAQTTREQPPVRLDSAIVRTSQKQGICWYFVSPRGCRKGDSCKFIHHTTTVPMQTNPNPPLPEVSSVGSSGLAAPGTHVGTPFVLRGPHSLPTRTVGSTLFGNVSSQQHTAFLAGPVSSVPQRPFKTPSLGSHNFQLASTNAFGGKNPFSPTQAGRTRSIDGFGEPKVVEEKRQAHSAPIVPQMVGESYFHFPSKSHLQFYLPRLKHASQNKSWQDHGQIYIDMKNEDVELDSSVLRAFYQAFEEYSSDTIGDSFDKFASKVQFCFEKEGLASVDPEGSPSSFLDVNDKYFFGQLGVALMYYCYQKKSYSQGYNVLHVLHNFSINYSLYTGEFGSQQRPLTTTEVSLTAADICLHLDTPAYSSALEVLRGTNYALPAENSGAVLSPEEAGWRRRVMQTMCQSFIKDHKFDVVYELLSEVGDIDVFGRRELKDLYNELLVSLIDNRELDVAGEVLKSMETQRISRDRETVRAFVNGFGEAGRMVQAKQHFISGCLSGVYPTSFNEDDPWTVVIGTSFSAFESQLYIENHLLLLYHHIEELAVKSGNDVLDENYYKQLKVIVESDEVASSRHKYMKPDEIIRCVREMLCTVLADDFNPPLSCQPQSNDQESTVDVLSLKRWFCANAASGRSKRAAFPFSTLASNTVNMHPYLQPGQCWAEGVQNRSRMLSQRTLPFY
ncbi:uncharacterized protein [Montipora capricornis]|uniref:uncharacterized protein isoform X2 n=1 Tax=Montipora capricornis TaxID=246305 RepID=UPI0035F16359